MAGQWLGAAIRSNFPKLAAALGVTAFDRLLDAFMADDPQARSSIGAIDARLPGYLLESDHPTWCAELAALDRAHTTVHAAHAALLLDRWALGLEHELRLIPAHTFVQITTSVDEVWNALHAGHAFTTPRELSWPRTVLVWRRHGVGIQQRTVDADETAALRAAARGTSFIELASGLGGRNPHARALDVVLRWIDDGVVAAPAD
jgi:hypothetical protein